MMHLKKQLLALTLIACCATPAQGFIGRALTAQFIDEAQLMGLTKKDLMINTGLFGTMRAVWGVTGLLSGTGAAYLLYKGFKEKDNRKKIAGSTLAAATIFSIWSAYKCHTSAGTCDRLLNEHALLP